jgi:hypothetical protein
LFFDSRSTAELEKLTAAVSADLDEASAELDKRQKACERAEAAASAAERGDRKAVKRFLNEKGAKK